MTRFIVVALVAFAALCARGAEVSLFDGKTMNQWEGDPKIWRIENGALTGGSLTEMVKRNEFLATKRDYTNFVIRFKIKLTGTEGFINSGFQIRSQRVPNSSEMKGYQCDFGEPNWYGAIYDEERRNRVISASDMDALRPVIKRDDWNDYVIRAEGRRVQTFINGVRGTDYIEQDPSIPDYGKLGIQVHGGGKALVQVKDIFIEELPEQPEFIGAPEPAKTSKASPLTGAEEQGTFTLPPGFEIELVAEEQEGIGKFVAVHFDTQGRMWSMTALEYPVDANENPEAAKALYASIAKDKIVVYDNPFGPGPHKPRVFAEGLAIPLGILPYKDGAYVQHGPDIKFLRDTNNDGKADKSETILSGFGVQDSHLFPHQFTRAPGNWIWFAQGAFNYGKVKTSKGAEHQFDQTRMAKFRYDGSDFDITSQGPCNIWGLVLKTNGEAFIQEANDYGYPMMPFHEYANYPGCSDGQMKSYAPIFPGTAPDFQMGGTGLSGLALSDATHWPAPYNNVFYIANPITRKIQAIRAHEDGPRYRLEKLPDFVLSSDEYFRPVALTLGPDGALYIVDWYNKIISHNEVPRTHPERDKTRGRIWRVKHKSAKPFDVPDFTKLPEDQLLAKLTDKSSAQVHLAWQAITDRNLTNMTGRLSEAASKGNIPALWALEGLKQVSTNVITAMLAHTDRNVRREAVRAGGENLEPSLFLSLPSIGTDENDPEVRAEIIRSKGRLGVASFVGVHFDLAPLSGPTMRSTQNGKIIKAGVAYEREFERYLVRLMCERSPAAADHFISSQHRDGMPHEFVEPLMLAALAVGEARITTVAQLIPELRRPIGESELLALARFPKAKGAADALKSALRTEAALQTMIELRAKFDPAAWTEILTDVARDLWGSDRLRPLIVQFVSAYRLQAFEEHLLAAATNDQMPRDSRLGAIKALREIGTTKDIEVLNLAKSGADRSLRQEAILTLASSKSDRAAEMAVGLWPELNALQRRLVLGTLAGSKTGATGLLKSINSGALPKTDLDSATLDKMRAVLPEDRNLQALVEQVTASYQPVLRLDGRNESFLDTDISLDGPFTVETWIKLAPGIDNNDGILGAPNILDINFAGEQLRVYTGPNGGDVIIAKKKTAPDSWTHIAITRDAAGKFAIYQNGELDTNDSKPATQKFANLKLAWTTPSRGTDGWLAEYRVWSVARTPQQIRADFDRAIEKADGLVHRFAGTNWPKLHNSARVERVADSPTLLTEKQARELEAKFEKLHTLAAKNGDLARGKNLFAQTCQTCHTVAGQGGQIGPVLNGAAATGLESLFRAVVTPNAAMEAGYRTFRIELRDGDVLDGFLVSQNDEAIVLRQPNAQDRRIPQDEIRRASFTKQSLMPEGLLESMSETDVTDLLAYLKTLK